MIGKEALEYIECNNIFYEKHTKIVDPAINEMFEIIKKDLEHLEKQDKILEILKKELVIETEYNFLTEKYDVFIYGERGFGEKIKIVVDKDKGDLLKEWLGNDK